MYVNSIHIQRHGGVKRLLSATIPSTERIQQLYVHTFPRRRPQTMAAFASKGLRRPKHSWRETSECSSIRVTKAYRKLADSSTNNVFKV